MQTIKFLLIDIAILGAFQWLTVNKQFVENQNLSDTQLSTSKNTIPNQLISFSPDFKICV